MTPGSFVGNSTPMPLGLFIGFPRISKRSKQKRNSPHRTNIAPPMSLGIFIGFPRTSKGSKQKRNSPHRTNSHKQPSNQAPPNRRKPAQAKKMQQWGKEGVKGANKGKGAWVGANGWGSMAKGKGKGGIWEGGWEQTEWGYSHDWWSGKGAGAKGWGAGWKGMGKANNWKNHGISCKEGWVSRQSRAQRRPTWKPWIGWGSWQGRFGKKGTEFGYRIKSTGKGKNGGSHQRKRNEGIVLGGGFNLYGSEGPDWIPKTSEDERDEKWQPGMKSEGRLLRVLSGRLSAES